MNKQEIKNILISLRNEENSPIVNNILGKIDLMDDSTLEKAAIKAGNTEESIKSFFIGSINSILKSQENNQAEEKFPLNKMFTYGLSGPCVHLHLPGKLDETIAKIGRNRTLALVNRNLIDALERIQSMKNYNHPRLENIDSVFMISPALIRSELSFLEDLDFDTEYFNRKDLENEELVNSNKNASLAIKVFGKDKNIGCASLPLDRMNSKQWQDKKNKKIKELEEKGATLDNKDQDIEEKD